MAEYLRFRSANVINNKFQLVSGFNGLRLDCSVFMLITIQSVAIRLDYNLRNSLCFSQSRK